MSEDPKRQQAVEALQTRLKEIATGKVYQLPDGPHTCQNNIKDVYIWRKTAFAESEIPAINLEDADAPVKPGPSGQHEHALHVTLKVAVSGKTSARVARSILADIVASIGSDPKLGGVARWTDLNSHEVDVEQAGSIITGVEVNITITYRTPLWRM